jgi:molecular chaperone DnaK (HSP70)
MRLGIDFGTTHTAVALVDRGNYPVVSFEWGDTVPSLLAVRTRDGAVCFGREAQELASEPDWQLVRSLKRLVQEAGPLTELHVAGHAFAIVDLLAEHLAQLRRDIVESSNAGAAPDERLEVAISVPANASNDQRFLTLDAFRRAGFDVLAMLNEPSAAGFEYGHRFRRTVTSRREYVLVYDLGGGTFDASLIHMAGLVNEVVASAGIPRLGGDDFDEVILDLVLSRARLGAEALAPAVRERLLESCRQHKEAIVPQSRRLVVDLAALGKAPIALPMMDVNEACRPLVEQTLRAIDASLRDPRRGQVDTVDLKELAGLYVVGGASSFPLVARQLRERFPPQRVKRSPYPFAATAIGLACFIDEGSGYQLSDCLTRHFGVWREAREGQEVSFDPIFARDTPLPARSQPPLSAVRRYRPVHNVGHFRYVECGQLREGRPDGGVTPWEGIWFPFDPALRDAANLAEIPVQRLDNSAPEIEERYSCSTHGIFEVTLTAEDGYHRSHRIARPTHR